MVIKVISDKGFLLVDEVNEDELDQLNVSFTKQVDGWHFKKKMLKSNWDGKVTFFYKNSFIPLGLWNEVRKVAKKYNFKLSIEGGDQLIDKTVDYDKFVDWVTTYFEGNKIQPRDYQIETAYKIIRYQKCLAELATSAGKTLILYIVMTYLKHHLEKFKTFIIVPTTSLVEQIIDDFKEYDSETKSGFIYQEIYSGRKLANSANLIVGTYQSLAKKDKEFFSDFNIVAVDEAHKIQAKSIQNILKACLHTTYRFGLSGTFPKEESLELYSLMAFTGPVITNISADFLIKRGDVTPCEIEIIKMRYIPIEVVKAFHRLTDSMENRKKILKLEQEYAIKNINRLEYIANRMLKETKNSLILFHRTSYGEMIYNYLRQHSEGRDIFHIDGGTGIDLREDIRKKLEEGEGKIIVASYGTFATGINVKNLHTVALTESFKADSIIRQSIGRGLRLHTDKKVVKIIDFVDDYSLYSEDGSLVWKNYLMRHSAERIETYKKQNFPYKVKRVNF